NIIQRNGEKPRPNFRDRPPGDRGPYVNRTPDNKPGGWPGDKGPDRSKDGFKGPTFKDTNKGPDGRPDFGKKDGEGWKGAPKPRGSASTGPFGTQGQGGQGGGGSQGGAGGQGQSGGGGQGQGGQGQGFYKGPTNNDPPKQPFVKEGFKAPD